MVADALSRKSVHALCMAMSQVRLREEIREMGINVIQKGGTMSNYLIEPEIYEEIRRLQKDDPVLVEKRVLGGDFEIAEDDSVRYRGRWCVPNVESLKRRILDEVHTMPY